MPLNVGEMRHVVTVQEATHARDPVTGEVTVTWSDVANAADLPAAIKPSSVRQFLESRADQAEITERIIIRYLSGLTANMRLVGVCTCHDGVIFNPRGMLPDNETGVEYITIPCDRGVNQG